MKSSVYSTILMLSLVSGRVSAQQDIAVGLEIIGPQCIPVNGTAVFYCNKDNLSRDLVWTISGNSGHITTSGVYTAPSQPGRYHIQATIAEKSLVCLKKTIVVTERPQASNRWIVALDIINNKIRNYHIKHVVSSETLPKSSSAEACDLYIFDDQGNKLGTAKTQILQGPGGIQQGEVISTPIENIEKHPNELTYQDCGGKNKYNIKLQKNEIESLPELYKNNNTSYSARVVYNNTSERLTANQYSTVSVSWDNGYSWQIIGKCGNDGHITQLQLPIAGIDTYTDPIVKFDTCSEFYLKTTIISLSKAKSILTMGNTVQ